jgi:hypothetical protein
VGTDDGPLKVCLDITPDEDDPYATLSAFDQYGEEVAKVRVAPNFKLSVTSASAWIETASVDPGKRVSGCNFQSCGACFSGLG